MAISSYTIGGKKFDDIGVESAVLETSNSAEDILTLNLTRPMDASKLFNPYSYYSLEGNGSTWGGWLDFESLSAQGGASEATTLRFYGPFRWLDLANFTRKLFPRSVGTSFQKYLEVTSFTLGKIEEYFPDTVEQFYKDTNGAQRMNLVTGKTVRNVKISANDQLTQIRSQISEKTPITLSGSLPSLKLPYIQKSDKTLGSVLSLLLDWFPSYTIRSSGKTLQLVDSSLSGSLHKPSDMEDLSLSPRWDILISKATIVYTWGSNGSSGENVLVSDISQIGFEDSATESNGSPRETRTTVVLEKKETPPDKGLAAQYLKWAGRLAIDTDFSIIGNLQWDWKPGDRIDVSSWYSGGQYSHPVIQTISRDLGSDTISVRAGSKRHLGLDQLVELARKIPPEDKDNDPEDETKKGTIRIKIEIPQEDEEEIDNDSSLSSDKKALKKKDIKNRVKWVVGEGIRSKEGNGEKVFRKEEGTYPIVWLPPSGYDILSSTKEEVTSNRTQAAEAWCYLKKLQVESSDIYFKITLTKEGSLYKATIGDGYLFRSYRPNDNLGSITNLNSPLSVSSGTIIFLEATISGNSVTSAKIDVDSGSSKFDPSANPWLEKSFVEATDNTSSGSQKLFRKLVGKIYSKDGGDTLQVLQLMVKNQVMEDSVIDGRFAKIMKEWDSGLIPDA